MIGHECRLSWTNSNGVVWVCQCGEVGNVTPLVGVESGVTARSRRRRGLTEGVAQVSHGRHLDAVRADVARRTERALADHGKRINLANAVLQRRGRHGHA